MICCEQIYASAQGEVSIGGRKEGRARGLKLPNGGGLASLKMRWHEKN